MTTEVTEKPDIARIFAEDPLNHSRKDIKAMVEYFRSARHLFNTGPKRKPATKKQPTAKQKETLAMAAEINLDELGL